ALAAACTAGCDPFTRLDFQPETDVPAGDRLASDHLELTEGRAIGVRVTPMAGDQPMDKDVVVELQTAAPDVADVGPSVDEGSFVVFGAGAGHTVFRVVVDGNDEGDLPVDVRAQ
ncbi:MAG TPA: hypothetical protein VHB21_11150, partial [Minicystis sp.]|nr:hypothetical protein [Minicystis sp.]